MRSSSEEKIICPFCGKTRYVTTIVDDGIDWEGHHRGQYYEEREDPGCDCRLSKILAGAKIKKMCLNCEHQKDGCCKCAKTIEEISNVFSVTGPVLIKDKMKFCKNWKINTALLTKNLEAYEGEAGK